MLQCTFVRNRGTSIQKQPKRILNIICKLVAVAALLAIATGARAQWMQLATNAPVNIVNQNSGKCLDMGGTANGAVLQQWDCANGGYSTSTNQEWEFQPASNGNYYVANVNVPGEYWNVDGNDTASGTGLQMYQLYSGAANEEFQAVSMGNGYYEFKGVQSGLCLNVDGGSTANGAQMQIYACDGATSESFKFVAPAASLSTGTAYNLVNQNSQNGSKCIDANGWGTTNGTTVQQWDCGNGSSSTQANQQWEFQSADNGNYYVINVNAPGEYWNVDGNETANGSLVQLYQLYSGAGNEEWTPVSMGNGDYEFVGVQSGLCLDTPGGSTNDGVQLDIWSCNGTGAQSFALASPSSSGGGTSGGGSSIPAASNASVGNCGGQTSTVTSNGIGQNPGGYFFSLFTSGGNSTMTFPGGTANPGQFALNWSGVGDMVGGVGWASGGSESVGYNVGSASGYNTISIYGWMTNPTVEYYIVEFGQFATGTVNGTPTNQMGTFSSDGHTYTTYEHQQVDQPSPFGTTTFEQYVDVWGGAAIGTNYTVTMANHFNNWQSLGMPLGSFSSACQDYMILSPESYGGGSGGVNATVW